MDQADLPQTNGMKRADQGDAVDGEPTSSVSPFAPDLSGSADEAGLAEPVSDEHQVVSDGADRAFASVVTDSSNDVSTWQPFALHEVADPAVDGAPPDAASLAGSSQELEVAAPAALMQNRLSVSGPVLTDPVPPPGDIVGVAALQPDRKSVV